ncbi:MAG: hypothetical protein WCV62_06575 [Candidatus Peribacteraceae bacterium]|jgi:hypothetical protein
MKKLRFHPVVAGILQALGILLYIVLFAFVGVPLIDNVEHTPVMSMMAPVFFLFTFSFSALLCAAITGTFPAVLLFQKRYRDAAIVIISMIIMMALLLALLLTALLMSRMLIR